MLTPVYLGLVLAALAFLAGVVLAFGALTIVWRRHWETFAPAESLLARLAAAVVVAMIAPTGMGFLINQILNLAGPNQFGIIESPIQVSTPDVRNRALAAIAIALALTVTAVLRIELYHRRVTGINRRQEHDEEWTMEAPEEKRIPR